MNSELPPAAPSAEIVSETKRRSPRARIFEILAILLVLGFLAAIIIPTTTHCGGPAYRSIDSSNLRQIGQASLIYACDHQDKFPQVDDIYAFARELARGGGLNDATIWISRFKNNGSLDLSTVLAADRGSLEPAFANIRPSFAAAVRGLHMELPSTTPIAWTRGLQPDGTWSKDSPYGGEGGLIVFLGGNVAFYRNTQDAFIDREGKQATDIRAALPSDAIIANN